MTNKKPLFITIEGGEGAGKSVQVELLRQYLKELGFDVLLVREPGGTKESELIRDVLLNPQNKLNALSELFLYEAARAQLVSEIIMPALSKGIFVLCDRFFDATIAYQGYGREINIALIESLNEAASFGIKPSLTIYLDIDPSLGLIRAKSLNGGDRMEQESELFHKAVRAGYLELAKKEPDRIKTVNADGGIRDIQKAILSLVNVFLRETRDV
jgi:dTMP kinase